MERSRAKWIALIFLACFCVDSDLPAQIKLSPATFNQPEMTLDFYKQSTTWNWLGRLFLQHKSPEGWNWQFAESFNSNLLVASRGEKKWKDEHNLRGYFYLQKSALQAGIYTRSWLQSDKQVSSDNQFANHVLGAFTSHAINRYLSITPYLGYQQSKNRNIIDYGWDVGLHTGVRRYRLGDYHTNLDLESNYDFYDQRQNYENKAEVKISTQFSPAASDSLFFSFSDVSKQYFTRDGIEKVDIYNRDLQNKLFYSFSARDLLLIYSRIQSRDISFFNGRNIFYVDHDIDYIHIGNRWSYTLNFRTSDETQDNAGTFTDSRARQSALGLELDYTINRNQSLNFDLAYVKLQYDTPDSLVNHDDRDEQRFVFNINYFHRFSPLLTLRWLAYAYLYHQIYIYREQSINNNWNRVFKLNPRISYRNGRLFNRLSTEVLANYTAYDFEDRLTQTRSFVFRKYTFSDSLTVRLFAENYAGSFVRIELEDKGSFFQQDFAQQLIQSYNSQFYNFFLFNDHFLYFQVKAGYTIYTRTEWRHIPEKRQNRQIVNEGPYFSINYRGSRRLVLSASAALSRLKDSNTKTTTYMTGYLRLVYNI